MMQANTGVRFETKDPLLSQLVKQAEEKCRLNIKNFGGDPVLVEGGGYEKIWLETQPMGGAMYASRDFATGLNNSLMFMRHQRADGRIPGSIAVIDGKVVPQFNKFQGFCFPEPALDLYYLGGKDAEYLAQLAKTLEAFDAYLWRVRDSDGDGWQKALAGCFQVKGFFFWVQQLVHLAHQVHIPRQEYKLCPRYSRALPMQPGGKANRQRAKQLCPQRSAGI